MRAVLGCPGSKYVDGAEFIQTYGGKMVLAKLLEGRATSARIERVSREVISSRMRKN